MGDPIFILLVGVIIVVGGIIGLKLHPFLALLLAVAFITAAGILAGMAQNANLGFNPVYLCLAIGSGAKLVP